MGMDGWMSGWDEVRRAPGRLGRHLEARARAVWGRIPPSLRGTAAFLAALFGALIVVGLAGYRGGTGFDVLRRWVLYGSAERSGGETAFSYEATGKDRTAALGSSLAILSPTGIRVLDARGEELWSATARLSSPALSRCGARAVAYDVGGTELWILDAGGLAGELTVEGPVLSARLDKAGRLTVTMERKGRKGAAAVYDAKLEELFEYDSGRRYLVDARTTDDGSRLAVVTLDGEDGVFEGRVLSYRMDREGEDPEWETVLPDALEVGMAQIGPALAVAADTCLAFLSPDGRTTASYGYEGAHLRALDLDGDGFAVLHLGRYASGNAGRLVTVGTDGEELGSLEVREEILDLSAAGRYVAALYPDRLVVYDPYLREYASLSGTEDVRRVVMRTDGSALLMGSASGRLYLP